MARNITAVTIFLASPIDVAHERDIVSLAVEEWNSRHGRNSNVFFELLRWETSVSAGFGVDGQAVINSQIPDDYDLLIAIFWTRIGSPTSRDSSGTVEEYRRAFSRFKKAEEVDIAFFFKDALIDFRSVDLNQVDAVKKFEAEVQESGALTKSFKNGESLKLEVSMLLDRIGNKFSEKNSDNLNEKKSSVELIPVDIKNIDKNEDLVDDIGLFDILDKLQNHAESAGYFLSNLTSNVMEITNVTNEVNRTFSEITSVRPLEIEETKPGVKKIAEAMDSFSQFLETEMPAFGENLMATANDVRDMVRVSYDWINADDALVVLTSFRATLIEMLKAISGSQISFARYLDETEKLQRTTTQFNKAKRRIINSGRSFIETNENGRALIEQALIELDKLILTIESGNSTQ